MSNNQADRLEFNLAFPLRASIVVGVAVLVLSGLYLWISESYKESFVFFAASVAAGSAILAALYAARAINFQVQQHEDANIDRDNALLNERQRQAMAYAARWNDPHMEQARMACRKVISLKGSGVEDVKRSMGEGDTEMKVIHMLNFMEEVSISAHHNISDADILKEYFRDVVVLVWRCMSEWAIDHRISKGQPSAWRHFDKIYYEWK